MLSSITAGERITIRRPRMRPESPGVVAGLDAWGRRDSRTVPISEIITIEGMRPNDTGTAIVLVVGVVLVGATVAGLVALSNMCVGLEPC